MRFRSMCAVHQDNKVGGEWGWDVAGSAEQDPTIETAAAIKTGSELKRSRGQKGGVAAVRAQVIFGVVPC